MRTVESRFPISSTERPFSMTATDAERWRELGQQLRVDSVRSSAAAKSGHPTSSMSAADLIAVLADKYLRYDFDAPEDPRNDHLIFSKGHASPLVYSLFKAAGAITDEELLTFRKLGSRLEGHPTPLIPWVDVATGSLGQGLPIGVGVALAGKRLDRLPYRVWVLCGDSEMAEGSMWEAFEHAAFYGLDNLTAIIDVNRLGQTGETMHGWDLDSYAKRAQAFGWHTIEIDGHDVDEIDEAYAEALAIDAKPTAIIAKTKKGKGVAAVEDKNGAHGKPLDDPEAAIAELGGERNLTIAVGKPEGDGTPHVFETGRARAAALRARRRGGDAQGVRRRARGARRGARRHRRARRRGVELDLLGDLPRGPPRAVRRVLHRRAAAACGRGGNPGARLAAVRLHLRRVPLPRLRLRPHGGDQPRDVLRVRLARRRVDRRGRPVADGARGSGRVPRRVGLDRALPVRRKPDGEARRGDGRPGRDLVPALDPRGDEGDLRPRRGVSGRRLQGRALLRRRHGHDRGRRDHAARGARSGGHAGGAMGSRRA